MSGDLKDILSNLNPDIDQELLLQYLQGKLSATQQHEVEKQMMNDEFDADALEGLAQLKNKKEINFLVEQLNQELRKKTAKKKKNKLRELNIPPWIIISLIVILLLIIVSYVIIFMYMKQM
jgi:hypothetical protein